MHAQPAQRHLVVDPVIKVIIRGNYFRENAREGVNGGGHMRKEFKHNLGGKGGRKTSLVSLV